MKIFKQIIFWILFIPIGILSVVVSMIATITKHLDNFIYNSADKYENWTFK
jgi:hypothetical protein